MTVYRCLTLVVLFFAAGACARPKPPEPELVTSATIKDIMDALIDPSADYVFESVATIADEHGITQKAPRTDEEWREVRRRVVQLLEAPNLLVMPGRKAARPGERSQNPEVELQPEQIQQLMDADPAAFATRARALQDAALPALRAVDEKNANALFEAAGKIDKACENCHLHYWYPGDKRAQEAAKGN